MDLVPLKCYFLLIDLSKNLLLIRGKQLISSKNSDKQIYLLLETLKNFINSPETLLVYKTFPLIPSFLENLIYLDVFYKGFFKKDLITTPELQTNIMDLKKEIDDVFRDTKGDVLTLIRKIKEYLQGDALEVDHDWQENNWLNRRLNNLYLTDAENSANNENITQMNKNEQEVNNRENDEKLNTTKDEKIKEFHIKTKVEEDFFNEKFKNNRRNIAQKILNSKIFYYLLNESMLKKTVEKCLEIEKEWEITKNHVDFPYFCDFLINYGKLYAVVILDPHKLLLGVENLMHPYFIEMKNFYEVKGIKTIYVQYTDYDNDAGKMLNAVKLKILHSK